MPVSHILKDPTAEKWRSINLTNGLIKPIVTKNSASVEAFLQAIGFTKVKENVFSFTDKDSKEVDGN
jgi:hypothetical protein